MVMFVTVQHEMLYSNEFILALWTRYDLLLKLIKRTIDYDLLLKLCIDF